MVIQTEKFSISIHQTGVLHPFLGADRTLRRIAFKGATSLALHLICKNCRINLGSQSGLNFLF